MSSLPNSIFFIGMTFLYLAKASPLPSTVLIVLPFLSFITKVSVPGNFWNSKSESFNLLISTSWSKPNSFLSFLTLSNCAVLPTIGVTNAPPNAPPSACLGLVLNKLFSST